MNLEKMNTSKTMSSIEVSELTGKRHDNVMADIRLMLAELKLNAPDFSGTQKYGNNNTREIFNLNEELTLTLVSGYNLKMRNAIIKLWKELEQQGETALPESFSEALRLAADQQEKIEQQAKQIAFKDDLIVASNEASVKAGEILVREFVKSVDIIDIGEKLFFQWMCDQKYLMKGSRQPYQQCVARGIFTWKPTEELHGGKYRYTLRITPRGKVWLAAKYMAYLDMGITA